MDRSTAICYGSDWDTYHCHQGNLASTMSPPRNCYKSSAVVNYKRWEVGGATGTVWYQNDIKFHTLLSTGIIVYASHICLSGFSFPLGERGWHLNYLSRNVWKGQSKYIANGGFSMRRSGFFRKIAKLLDYHTLPHGDSPPGGVVELMLWMIAVNSLWPSV